MNVDAEDMSSHSLEAGEEPQPFQDVQASIVADLNSKTWPTVTSPSRISLLATKALQADSGAQGTQPRAVLLKIRAAAERRLPESLQEGHQHWHHMGILHPAGSGEA